MKQRPAKIEVYQDKRGSWRWRFLVQRRDDWDIQAVSSNIFPREEEAELNARTIICHPWDTDVDFEISVVWWQKLINYFTR